MKLTEIVRWVTRTHRITGTCVVAAFVAVHVATAAAPGDDRAALALLMTFAEESKEPALFPGHPGFPPDVEALTKRLREYLPGKRYAVRLRIENAAVATSLVRYHSGKERDIAVALPPSGCARSRVEHWPGIERPVLVVDCDRDQSWGVVARIGAGQWELCVDVHAPPGDAPATPPEASNRRSGGIAIAQRYLQRLAHACERIQLPGYE